MPLALSIAYDRPAISGAGDQKVVTGYHTVVTNDLTTVAARRRLSQFMVLNDTNKQVFVLVEAKGPAETPTELVARLKDFGNETVSFAPGKPYVRVIGYEVDLKYAVTGVDWMAAGEMEVVYDFYHPTCAWHVAVRCRVPREAAEVPTVSGIYPGANWHERETHEFFGIRFSGHPDLSPLLLPEDADYHPLRKDFAGAA